MSIINNVLKDLESRSSRFTPIEVAAASSGVTAQNRSKTVMSILLPGLIVFTMAVIYYQIIYKPEINQTLEAAVVSPSDAVLPEMDNTSTRKPVVNQITGLQIRETVSDVSLEFSMHEKAVSYLKERSENSFIYHLKNIHSEIEAPRINSNRWIENLELRARQQGIDVILRTVPGVLVNTAQVKDRGENLWTIKLEKLPDPITVAKLESVVVQPQIKSEEVINTGSKSQTAKVNETKAPLEEKAPEEPVKVEIKSTSQSLSDSAKLNKAVELIRAKQWHNAEILLRGLMHGPLDFSAKKQLLVLYSRSGDTGNYFKLAKRSYQQYPQQSLFRTAFARALFQQQQYLQAINLLHNAAQLDSVQHALLAASYQRKDQHQKAVEHYHHALKLDGRQARNWIGLGISLEHEAKLEKALQSYQTALRLGNLNERLIQFVEQRSRMLKKVMN